MRADLPLRRRCARIGYKAPHNLMRIFIGFHRLPRRFFFIHGGRICSTSAAGVGTVVSSAFSLAAAYHLMRQ